VFARRHAPVIALILRTLVAIERRRFGRYEQPEPGAWGPTNNLFALGNHLRERGIRTVFVIEESFEGELDKRRFEERLMRMAPPPEGEETVGGGWADQQLAARLDAASKRLQTSPGRVLAADLIEKIALG
jgi:hypothetical protein